MFSNESLPLGCTSFRAISMESQSILFITSWDKDCLGSQYVFALSECPILWTVCCKLDKILEFEYHKAHGSWSIRNCLGWFIAFGRKPLARGSTSTFKASSWVEESTEQCLSWWPLTCNIFHCTEERSQSLQISLRSQRRGYRGHRVCWSRRLSPGQIRNHRLGGGAL